MASYMLLPSVSIAVGGRVGDIATVLSIIVRLTTSERLTHTSISLVVVVMGVRVYINDTAILIDQRGSEGSLVAGLTSSELATYVSLVPVSVILGERVGSTAAAIMIDWLATENTGLMTLVVASYILLPPVLIAVEKRVGAIDNECVYLTNPFVSFMSLSKHHSLSDYSRQPNKYSTVDFYLS